MIHKIYFRPQVLRFVLLFVARTGSTLFITALNSHPKVVAHGESLEEFKEGESSSQLDRASDLLIPPLIGRCKVLGFKTKLVVIMEPIRFAQLLHKMQCKIIYMRRRNHIKAVVSRLKAMRLYHATGEWNLFDETNRLAPFVIDLL